MKTEIASGIAEPTAVGDELPRLAVLRYAIAYVLVPALVLQAGDPHVAAKINPLLATFGVGVILVKTFASVNPNSK